MSLILNINRDLLAQDTCYGCSFYCMIEWDVKIGFVYLIWGFSMDGSIIIMVISISNHLAFGPN